MSSASGPRDAIRFSQVRSLLGPQRRLLMIVAVGVLGGAALEALPPLIVREAVDQHIAIGRTDGLLTLGALYLSVVGAQQALGFLSSFATTIASQRALRELRSRLFAHLQRLPADYFDTIPTGDTVSRATADVDTIDRLFTSGIATLIGDLTRLFAIAIAMSLLSVQLTLLAAIAIPPLILFTRWFQSRVLTAERLQRRAIGRVQSALIETLHGIETIRAFGRSAFFEDRFRGALQSTLNSYCEATRYSALYTPLMVITASLLVAMLLWSGTEAASTWGLSIGTLAAFVLLFRRLFTPITTLGEEWQTVQSALSGAERVFGVLSLPTQPEPLDAPTYAASQSPPLLLADVVFGYADGEAVLRNISLAVEAGEHVALVGRTGAGKSSLLHLAGGLYAPRSGSVRIDGLDPHAMDDRERQRRLGIVPQTLHLFSGTILDNLKMGDDSISTAAVLEAAKLTGSDVFIRAFPRGYDTRLGAGESALALSAGQRQLLALTRALIRQPNVLLLDEATAAIDAAADTAVRDALRREAHDRHRAVLIVAHRLATARAADRVIVLEAGQIVEQGPPADLIRQRGRFAAMVAVEAAGWDWQVD
jgi:ATP-binding cassette subfamily B multidrug efflux pump